MQLLGSANPFAAVAASADAVPVFVDWTADGNLDLVVGGQDGTLKLYENQGDNPPTVVELTGADNKLGGIPVGTNYAPAFTDWDGDGNDDLIIGKRDGTLSFFAGDGTGAVTEQTDDDNPFKDIDVGTDSSPAIADWDGDSDADLIVGDGDGKVHYFERQSDGSVGAAATGTASPFTGMDVGFDAAPTSRRALALTVTFKVRRYRNKVPFGLAVQV